MMFDLKGFVEKSYKPRKRTPDWLGSIGDVIRVVDYITSDQELEGRQYAVEFAADLYKPIFDALKLSIREARVNANIQTLDFKKATVILRNRYNTCRQEIDELEESIEELVSQKSELLPIRKALQTLEPGQTCFTPVANPDFLRFRSSTANLDDKMEEKRRKFFNIELHNQISLLEEKLSTLRNERNDIFKRIKNVRQDELDTLSKTQELVDKTEKEYLNKACEYKLLQMI